MRIRVRTLVAVAFALLAVIFHFGGAIEAAILFGVLATVLSLINLNTA